MIRQLSTAPILAFGKACGATKNWHIGITLLAADAHLRHSSRLGQAEQTTYMESPEVWTEIQAVYDEYLKHHPDDKTERSKYAMLCYLGAHYVKAHAQFLAVGDGLTTWPTFPNMPFATMTAARDFTARFMENRRRTGAAPTRKGDGAPQTSK
jgi:hypothetical protein